MPILGGGEVFELAGKLLAVLAADGDVHLPHGCAQAIPQVHGRGIVALDVVVHISDHKPGFGASGNDTGFEFVRLVRVGQLPGADHQAGPPAVGLPALPVLVAMARGEEALQENRVRVADVFGLYNLVK